ncbi:tetratricopeptide repeat protein [Anabaena sp. FACHB-1237]|uniref:tetratricopeptide repeat protein n=1 Tax=Anabaena sp. FACHB-1237 TaxID=2692769 RepID=UPI0016816D05|nr:tetratricopeptide repeat protein [Anabaena sp. FACHB-1237]MBD2136581.1 tetratricopeptide repeat protein [Anabaena sp. FACHB-1237]
MDGIILLRSLQADFIKRLHHRSLLHCEIIGQHSELTIIKGERLTNLRNFCWLMAEKYKRTSIVRDVFVSNLKGKLGEEVVKERLGNLITEINYEQKIGGDGKSDFTLTSHPHIGLQVKSRHGTIDQVRWTVTAQEVSKNTVIVCILIEEDVNESQSFYHLFLAGFLPTAMIKLKTGKISFGIDQLLYAGGLFSYLESFANNFLANSQTSHISESITSDKYIPEYTLTKNPIHGIVDIYSKQDLSLLYMTLGDEYLAKAEYPAAINSYHQSLQINTKNCQTCEVYYKLGAANYQIGEYQLAISHYSQSIKINTDHAQSYHGRGLVHYQMDNYYLALADYNQAIVINPYIATFYQNRAELRLKMLDYQGAIEDYYQAMIINPNISHDLAQQLSAEKEQLYQLSNIVPNDAHSYTQRGKIRTDLGDYQGAISDYTMAINMSYHDIDIYYLRGNAHYRLGNKTAAIADFSKAVQLYWHAGKLEEYQDIQAKIVELEVEASLDILNF